MGSNAGTLVPKNFRPQEGWNFRSMERSSPGTFVPGDANSLENVFLSVYLLTYKKVTFSNGV